MSKPTPTTRNPEHPVVFFDVCLGGISGESLGRIKIELFSTIVPKTAENFRQLCTGETKGSNGKPMGYKGCKFHRVVSNRISIPFFLSKAVFCARVYFPLGISMGHLTDEKNDTKLKGVYVQ